MICKNRSLIDAAVDVANETGNSASPVCWRSLVRELVGGSGYTATHERGVSFGLGTRAEYVEVEVNWASGRQQSLSNMVVDTEYVLIAGHTAQ